MKSAIVHIGTEKSGSTYLQEVLAANQEDLAAAGFHFPANMGRNHNHIELAAAFAPVPMDIHRVFGIATAADQQQFRSRLDGAMASLPDGKWIFTGEHLSSRLNRDALVRDFTGFLRRHFESITVVAFLRRQDFMLPSAYSTYIKSGGSKPVDSRFVADTYLDHAGLMRRWSAALQDTETLIMVPYLEAFQQEPLEIAHRFERACGLPAGVLARAPDRASNRRLSVLALEAMRAINGRTSSAGELALGAPRERVFAELSDALGGPSWDISTQQADELRQHWSRSNRAVFEEFPDPGWVEWEAQPHVGAPEEWIDLGIECAGAVDAVLGLFPSEHLVSPTSTSRERELALLLEQAESRVAAMEDSRSWRATAKIRSLTGKVRSAG